MIIKIFTLNGYRNYGNRLQLFALSETLKQYGKIKVFWPKTIKSRIKEAIKYHSPLLLTCLKEYKLKKFSDKYIPGYTADPDADCAIIGSDQVWNMSYTQSRQYLLKIPGASKKIAYAASIGASIIPDNQVEVFKDALANYDSISVREKAAKKALSAVTSKTIEVVLDPTLLLEREQYESMEKKPSGIIEDEKYILYYILGNRDHEEAIRNAAAEKGYRVIFFSDRSDSNYGVEEFLYLIHHAQLICTDSFHACVFSIIFERPFVAFKRTGEADYMYSRLKNLIDAFGLEGREYNGKKITEDNFMVDYSKIQAVLSRERAKSLDYLQKALGGVENE